MNAPLATLNSDALSTLREQLFTIPVVGDPQTPIFTLSEDEFNECMTLVNNVWTPFGSKEVVGRTAGTKRYTEVRRYECRFDKLRKANTRRLADARSDGNARISENNDVLCLLLVLNSGNSSYIFNISEAACSSKFTFYNPIFLWYEDQGAFHQMR